MNLTSRWRVLEVATEGSLVNFTFGGRHDPTHGGQMCQFMEAALRDRDAVGIVVDLLEYEYEFGNDLSCLFLTGYDKSSRASRPVCVAARGRTRSSLEALLEAAGMGAACEVTFTNDVDEALRVLRSKPGKARGSERVDRTSERRATIGQSPDAPSSFVWLLRKFGPWFLVCFLVGAAVALLARRCSAGAEDLVPKPAAGEVEHQSPR